MIIITVMLVLIITFLASSLHREIIENKRLSLQLTHVTQANTALVKNIRLVSEVIGTNTGGVGKRIREHQEILDAITSSDSDLLSKEPGLQYWLNANLQFFVSLRNVAYPTQFSE